MLFLTIVIEVESKGFSGYASKEDPSQTTKTICWSAGLVGIGWVRKRSRPIALQIGLDWYT